MALSAGLHLAILALGWSSTLFAPEVMEFVTYEIELVSPPPARQAEEPAPAREEMVVERPDPEPLPPEPEVEEIVPIEDPEPEPEPEEVEETAEELPPEVDEAPVVAATEEPVEEEAELSGEGLNVRIEGLRRDYPEYYNNIIRQIQRCFRWRDGGNWQTTVFFYIDREGNAEGLEFVSRSGSTAFDFEAMGAVECAGRGRFGPLPEELPYDRFPVRFSFQPMGEPVLVLPAAPRPTEVTFSR
jgi:outer membrane biosynthesis protein TonB